MSILPKLQLKTLRKVLFISLLIAFTFGSGFYVGTGNAGRSIPEAIRVKITRDLPANHDTLEFSLFWKVWDTLSDNYYDKSKLVESEMVYGAIRGLVGSVGDPYTVFLPPEENKVVQEDLHGSFEGVGIQIGFKGTNLAVIAPLPGSPGEKAGVKPGDLIVGIKDDKKGIDRSTNGITLPEAVEAIRGPASTTVTLALMREGREEPFIVDIQRASIDVPSVVLAFVGENESVAHLKVLKFSGETSDEWDDAVRQILAKGNIKGIVVDVRNNPGGYLQGAIDLSSEFLKTGSVVVIEEGKGGDKKEYKADRLGRLLDKPVVVLMNQGSASASEILAGALKDGKGSKLIGEKSFGKGTIQEPIQIQGAGLHITIARWLTPSGFWVNGEGLTPDVEIKDDEATPEDEQMLEALKSLAN